ncbi:MAG TPA: hypothetical protein VF737_16170 [Gemmatimonadaceae bacterium]
MSFFLAALGLGLGGLLLMAIPGLRRHGHAGHARGRTHAAARAGARGHAAKTQAPHAPGTGAPAHPGPTHAATNGLLHYLPEPRVVFSVLALLGAVGNALLRLLRVPVWSAALGATAIAVLVEWAVVGRLWRLALRFTGEPASPLASLVMDEAEAVTAFRNGKGIVRAVLDGRAVQLSAELIAGERAVTVRVGDRVTIQEVDPDREHVRVSLR